MSPGDDLLQKYLCASPEDSERVLAELWTAVLLPACLQVVRARLSRHRECVEDITQEVAIGLVRRLRQIHVTRDHSSIRGVAQWAMGAASNACSGFLRNEHPLRTHLANALRYRFHKSVTFLLWKAPNRRMVCGWHRCRAAPPLTHSAFQQVLTLPRVAARLATIEPEYDVKLWRALASVFAFANGPIYFQSLVSELISRTANGDCRMSGLDGIAEPEGHERPDDVLIRKELLRVLWQRVMRLPPDQKLALLLNLRGTEGLAAWWEHDVVTRSTVAETLTLPVEMLERLPLSDLEIADVLRLDGANDVNRRQRVINLRRDAKRSLAKFSDFPS